MMLLGWKCVSEFVLVLDKFLSISSAPPCSSLLLSAPEPLRSRSGAAPEQLLHFCLLIWWLYVCCSGAAPLWLLWPWISEGEKELLRSQMRSSPPNFPIINFLWWEFIIAKFWLKLLCNLLCKKVSLHDEYKMFIPLTCVEMLADWGWGWLSISPLTTNNH